MFILGQSIINSRKSGVYSALGICSGILVHTFLAAFGLSLILRNSITAFNIVKFLGAMYLVYMGIKSIKAKDSLLVAELDNFLIHAVCVIPFHSFLFRRLCRTLTVRQGI